MAHVEKDFWVTEVLRGVVQCSADTGVTSVLKGGTSLSKAFGLIRRFSEDVDVIVIAPGHGRRSDDRCLKAFIAAAEAATGLTAEVDARTVTAGVKRTARLPYPSHSTVGALKEGVLLELGARGGAVPTLHKTVYSLIADHGPAAGLPTDFEEARSFDLHVLAPVRTLIEKLTIVHHATCCGSDTEQARHARHYYDIWCLLNDRGTIEALQSTPADLLAREVVTFTATAKMATTPRPEGGFASSPAFDTGNTHPAREAYESIVLRQLIWPASPLPSFADCCTAVHHHAPLL